MAKTTWTRWSENNKIWWLDQTEEKGACRFSFDKQRVFFMYRDFPWELTPEQVRIFIKEEPVMARLFKARIEEYKKTHPGDYSI